MLPDSSFELNDFKEILAKVVAAKLAYAKGDPVVAFDNIISSVQELTYLLISLLASLEAKADSAEQRAQRLELQLQQLSRRSDHTRSKPKERLFPPEGPS